MTCKGVDIFFLLKSEKHILSGLTWGMIGIPVVRRDRLNGYSKKRLRLKRSVR